MKKKLLAAMLLGSIVFSPSSEAAKTDAYRDALINKSFTLKYKIVTPTIRRTNKEMSFLKKSMFAEGYFEDNININTERQVDNGIIVFDGDNKYVEKIISAHTQITRSPYAATSGEAWKKNVKDKGICTLIKDNNVFNFQWDYNSEGQKKYFGGRGAFGLRSSSVKANDDKNDKRSPYEKFLEEYNYGSAALAQALTALLPPERVIATPNTPEYKLIGSGYIPGGLTYEDFAGQKNDTHYAVRYYFDGDRMIKIAAFNYSEDSTGIKSYEKTVVEITEFSTTPDQTYLSLPEGLKDKTKRKKGDSK